MARISIKDLPKDMKLSGDEFRKACQSISVSKLITFHPHHNPTKSYQSLGDSTLAAIDNNAALSRRRKYAESMFSLGVHQNRKGEYKNAVNYFREAIEMMPEFPHSYCNLAYALQNLGMTEEAIERYLQFIFLAPEEVYPEFLQNLAFLLLKEGRDEDAEYFYLECIKKYPCFTNAYISLSNLYKNTGYYEKSVNILKQLMKHSPTLEIELRIAFTVDRIMDSNETIEKQRKKLLHSIENLHQKNMNIGEFLKGIGEINFSLAYHGRDDKEILEKIGRLHIKNDPSLVWESPHCKTWRNTPLKSRIKLGIISDHLTTDHTIFKLNYGIINHLPRDLFYVVFFSHIPRPGKDIDIVKNIVDETIILDDDFNKARKQIAQKELDIIFYPSVGMNAFSYFISFSRLAPVQCVTWGHPNTVGSPNLDYFIVSKNMVLDNADEHFCERLIQLENISNYYYRPKLEQEKYRKYFSLPESAKIYLCPQTLFKFHPDFCGAAAKVLQTDARGLLVLIEGKKKGWKELLIQRFKKHSNRIEERMIFLPFLAYQDFLSLQKIADVILDPFHFGGGNTSYEAFAFGMPVVTWPSDYLKGRLTYSFYCKMGIYDLIARDHQQYIELALKVANDDKWRNKMIEKIKSRNHVLYENKNAVKELAAFLARATIMGKEGKLIENWVWEK